MCPECGVQRSKFLGREFVPTRDSGLQIRARARKRSERPRSRCHVTARLCINLAGQRIVQRYEAWRGCWSATRAVSSGIRQHVEFRIYDHRRRGDIIRRARSYRLFHGCAQCRHPFIPVPRRTHFLIDA